MAVHIDLRSAKVTELLAEPRATLLIWEQKARLQIRLRVQVEVKSGQTVTADWQRVPESGRRVYGTQPTPGTSMDKPGQITQQSDPSMFAVLVCHITEIETLHLGDDLHNRAKFCANNSWIGSWHAL